MWPNSYIPANLVTSTEEIFDGKLHFFSMLRTAPVLLLVAD